MKKKKMKILKINKFRSEYINNSNWANYCLINKFYRTI